MATESGSRGERRRRILSRESERMALITGRLRNLPSSPPPSPSSPSPFSYHQNQTHHRGHSHTGIPPSFFSKDHHKDPYAGPISHIDSIDGTFSSGDSDSISNSKSKDENAGSFLKHAVPSGQVLGRNSHQLHKNDSIVKGSTVMPTSSALLMVQKASSIDKEPQLKPQAPRPKLFTSKRINSCILASQTTRTFCSMIIASLVVLSYIDYPLFGRNIVRSESVVASKPIYILLITDITIVVARMVLERQRESEELAEEERDIQKEDGRNWDAAVKVLERGLVVYQAFRGIFIDFSVYAVVVICGLSLV